MFFCHNIIGVGFITTSLVLLQFPGPRLSCREVFRGRREFVICNAEYSLLGQNSDGGFGGRTDLAGGNQPVRGLQFG
jgi:hypothetical protein